MSSGFVSGGTTEAPIERDDEWLKAQQDIEATRRRKEEQSRQKGGKTLYEVLQSNKAAKQEAFEESIKLKNQFRNLDEDEIEFLDSVLESTREKEEAVKKETTEQLDLFRKQQEQADKSLLEEGGNIDEVKGEGQAGSPTGGENQWAVNAKKRKRVKEKESLKGFKLRKSSFTAERPTVSPKERQEVEKVVDATPPEPNAESNKSASPVSTGRAIPTEAPQSTIKGGTPKPAVTPNLGLGGYSSDEED